MKAIFDCGVAAGASRAVRLRRPDENAENVTVERAPFVSHASCGLPSFFLQEGSM